MWYIIMIAAYYAIFILICATNEVHTDAKSSNFVDNLIQFIFKKLILYKNEILKLFMKLSYILYSHILWVWWTSSNENCAEFESSSAECSTISDYCFCWRRSFPHLLDSHESIFPSRVWNNEWKLPA